jgi:hypothetical protein
MPNSLPVAISDLSDAELDAVAAGYGYSFKQIALGNFALQIASNNQVNASFLSVRSSQGGGQTNNNNAGNMA